MKYKFFNICICTYAYNIIIMLRNWNVVKTSSFELMIIKIEMIIQLELLLPTLQILSENIVEYCSPTIFFFYVSDIAGWEMNEKSSSCDGKKLYRMNSIKLISHEWGTKYLIETTMKMKMMLLLSLYSC